MLSGVNAQRNESQRITEAVEPPTPGLNRIADCAIKPNVAIAKVNISIRSVYSSQGVAVQKSWTSKGNSMQQRSIKTACNNFASRAPPASPAACDVSGISLASAKRAVPAVIDKGLRSTQNLRSRLTPNTTDGIESLQLPQVPATLPSCQKADKPQRNEATPTVRRPSRPGSLRSAPIVDMVTRSSHEVESCLDNRN